MINTTYEPFSKEPEYRELNRQFIQCIIPQLKGLDCVVDLACGVGTLTELLFTELRHHAAKLEQERGAGLPGIVDRMKVIGVDISRESLKLAQDHFKELGMLVWPAMEQSPRQETYDRVLMVFVEAIGDRLPVADTIVDTALLGNAIHCFIDKARLFQEVHRVLRTAGVFAFNTTFYAGSIVKGTEKFYEEWMKQALRYIKGREEEYRDRGMDSVLRKRGRGRPAFSNRWLTLTEYRQTLNEHGFDVVCIAERRIEMSRGNFETVGAYAELASVLMSGYPVELACEALESAVDPAFETVGLDAVPRSWLEVIGVKR